MKTNYRYTYEVITPESAENGDASDRGFWMPGGWEYSTEGDARNAVIAESRNGDFDQACERGWLKDILNTIGKGEVSVSGCEVTSYEIDADVDYATGAETRRAVHVKCASEASAKRVARALGWRR